MDGKLKSYNNKNDNKANKISKYQNVNNFIINEINRENQKLKLKIEKLITANMNITVKNEQHKRIINLLKNKERECMNLQVMFTEKLKEIENLQKIVLDERKNHKEELRKQRKELNNELLERKREHDTIKFKIDNFDKMNNVNILFYNKILELEKDIEQLKKEEELKMNMKEFEYNNKIDKYRKRLIDFLNKNKKKEEDNQISLLNKVNLMHIQELISEIEFQNQEVNNLLKERKELKIKILNLSNDLHIYKIMVLTLSKKNDDYQKKLKVLNKKKDKFSLFFQSKKDIFNSKNQNINNEMFDKKFRLYSPLLKKNNNIYSLNVTRNRKNENKDKINNNTHSNNNASSPLSLNLENITSYDSKNKREELLNIILFKKNIIFYFKYLIDIR